MLTTFNFYPILKLLFGFPKINLRIIEVFNLITENEYIQIIDAFILKPDACLFILITEFNSVLLPKLKIMK